MQSSEQIAEAVEDSNDKFLVYDNIKPKIRRELVTDFLLNVERTSDKKWLVSIDKPKSEAELIVEKFKEEGEKEMRGNFPSKTRKQLKLEGVLCYKEKGTWVACIAENKMKSILESGRKISDGYFCVKCTRKLDHNIKKCFLENGYTVDERACYTTCCGYDDAWDPCTCYTCRSGAKNYTGIYEIYFKQR